MQPLTLRPHPRVRAVFVWLAAFGALFPLVPVVFGTVPGRWGRDHAVLDWSDRWIFALGGAALVTCPLVVMAVRTLRAGVWVTEETVVVRDLVATRRFPRSAVVDLTEMPAIHFRTAKGRDRFAAMYLFGYDSWRRAGVVPAYNIRCLERLERVLFGQETSGSQDRRSRRRRRRPKVRGPRAGRRR